MTTKKKAKRKPAGRVVSGVRAYRWVRVKVAKRKTAKKR